MPSSIFVFVILCHILVVVVPVSLSFVVVSSLSYPQRCRILIVLSSLLSSLDRILIVVISSLLSYPVVPVSSSFVIRSLLSYPCCRMSLSISLLYNAVSSQDRIFIIPYPHDIPCPYNLIVVLCWVVPRQFHSCVIPHHTVWLLHDQHHVIGISLVLVISCPCRVNFSIMASRPTSVSSSSVLLTISLVLIELIII